MSAAAELPSDPKRPEKHIDPATGIWPISEWGYSCAMGFVSDSRFGSSCRVIKRTNRETTRRWRRSGNSITTGASKQGGDK